MNDPILARAHDLLTATPRIGKRRVAGEILETDTGDDMPDLVTADLIAALKEGRDLSRDELKEVIRALDVLTVALPDLGNHTFNDSIQSVAGKLRERYARAYKSSAYAD